jgi:hypothetical protein
MGHNNGCLASGKADGRGDFERERQLSFRPLRLEGDLVEGGLQKKRPKCGRQVWDDVEKRARQSDGN